MNRAVVSFPAAELMVGAGVISLSSLPGRGGDLAGDLQQLKGWGADLVVSLTEGAELAPRSLTDIGDGLRLLGVRWMSLPIPDFGIPVAEDTGALLGRISAELLSGRRVALHCMGGCGRSGMIALRLMLMAGEAPVQALSRLRAKRPCAIETEAQMDWALDI